MAVRRRKKKSKSKTYIANKIRTILRDYKKTGRIGTSRPKNMKQAQRQAIAVAYSMAKKKGYRAEEFGAIGGSDLGHDSSISLEYTKKALKDARRHIALVGSLRHRYERGKIKGMIDEVIQETYTLFPQDQWLAEGESFGAEEFGAEGCEDCKVMQGLLDEAIPYVGTPDMDTTTKHAKGLIEKMNQWAWGAESFGAESKPRGPYVFPKRKAFPIGDLEHAKRALVFAEWPNNRKNRAKVRKAVFKRYPQLRKSAESFNADTKKAQVGKIVGFLSLPVIIVSALYIWANKEKTESDGQLETKPKAESKAKPTAKATPKPTVEATPEPIVIETPASTIQPISLPLIKSKIKSSPLLTTLLKTKVTSNTLNDVTIRGG